MPQDPFGGFQFVGGMIGSNPTNAPYPDRQLPSWMPTMSGMTGELQNEYGRVRQDFSTEGYDTTSTRQEQNTLSAGLNAGNNAAAAYANKARQAGGSGLGAGVVKAESVVAGRRAAGDIALQREQYDIQQREAAATQAANIASTLGDLRNRYLSSLVTYTTNEDRISAEFANRNRGSGSGGPSPMGGFNMGSGLGEGSSAFNFGNFRDAQNYFTQHAGNYTPFGFVPGSENYASSFGG